MKSKTGSANNNKRNNYCICGHHLHYHSKAGCHYSINNIPTTITKWCFCQKFRPAMKVKNKRLSGKI